MNDMKTLEKHEDHEVWSSAEGLAQSTSLDCNNIFSDSWLSTWEGNNEIFLSHPI